jgi:hypothetical protein
MGADATVAALSDYFVQRFNLAGRDAEYKKNRVTLAMLPRNTTRLAQGNGFYETVRVADAWSDSPDFAAAMANYSNDKTFRWLVGDPYVQYGRATFDGLLLARNNVGTIIDTKGAAIDGVGNNMLDSLEFQLWNTVAARGQISSTGLGGTAAARVLTLTDEDSVYNFPVNMVCTASTTNTGAGTDRVDVYKVTAIDPINKAVSLTRITGSSSDWAALDYVFAIGSKDAYMPGIATFIPTADPTDTLFGVARTGQGPALSGWRFPYVGSISETIQRAYAKMGKYVNRSAMRFTVCLSATDWLLLSLEQQGQILRNQEKSQEFGTGVLDVMTPFGAVPCIAIPQLKDGQMWGIDWTSWELYTLKNLPHVIDDDGRVMQRLAPGSPINNNLNGDGVEMRFRVWKAMLCLAPIANFTSPTR